MSGLTAKQKAFIDEYFVDFNGTRAAQRAGYAGNDNVLATSAWRLLRNAEVSRHIAERFQAQCMTANECLARLGEQARGDIGEFIANRGVLSLGVLKKTGLTHLIRSVSETKQGLRIEMYSAQHALELIGKAHGLFKERYEHTGEITTNVNVLSYKQRMQRVYGEDEEP